jgi:hypothetical protein
MFGSIVYYTPFFFLLARDEARQGERLGIGVMCWDSFVFALHTDLAVIA